MEKEVEFTLSCLKYIMMMKTIAKKQHEKLNNILFLLSTKTLNFKVFSLAHKTSKHLENFLNFWQKRLVNAGRVFLQKNALAKMEEWAGKCGPYSLQHIQIKF